MNDSRSLIIVPDVHGRDFWKETVKGHPEAFIIFLGDYLDPYPSEGFSMDDALRGLNEIIALKKSNPDRVVLLWGNHDLHYLYPEIMGTRYDLDRGPEIAKILYRNQDLFQICVEGDAGGKRFLFSHAGICCGWLETYFPDIDCGDITPDKINALVLREDFEKAFAAVSLFRGGDELVGSPVWADVCEHLVELNRLPGNVVQVFGHTKMTEPLNIDGKIYCLDCQRCFTLDLETGVIETISPADLTQSRPRTG